MKANGQVGHHSTGDAGENGRTPPVLPGVMTPTEAAALIGRSRSWVFARIADGTLPHIRIGTRIFLKTSELRAGRWIAA
jgi:excisionase family DNA binding protein